MAKNKTTQTNDSVADYLAAIKDEQKRADCSAIVQLMAKHSGFEPKMWGTSIVGFGLYHYKYESGREGDAPLAGLSSRANAITLYLSHNFDQREELLSAFGKHKTGKACIYIQKLEDVDTAVLAKMVKLSVAHTRKKYPK